jgi:hypothetical protein
LIVPSVLTSGKRGASSRTMKRTLTSSFCALEEFGIATINTVEISTDNPMRAKIKNEIRPLVIEVRAFVTDDVEPNPIYPFLASLFESKKGTHSGKSESLFVEFNYN